MNEYFEYQDQQVRDWIDRQNQMSRVAMEDWLIEMDEEDSGYDD